MPKIAAIYQKKFPQDKIVIGDAHSFLLKHFKEFDFIWSSPPCPTHSVMNHFLHAQGHIRYPDMALYQEIIFLRTFCKAKFCVENVKSYYEPLVKPQESGRHYFWANFIIPFFKHEVKNSQIGKFGPTKRGKIEEKSHLERDKVDSKLGLAILEAAFKTQQKTLSEV